MADSISEAPATAPEPLNRSHSSTRRIWQLATPVLIQQALIICVGLFDQFLAGNYPPADPSQHKDFQAAQTTANYLGWYISNAMVLVTVGATAMVSRMIGAGDRAMANRVMHQSILLAIAFGLLFSTFGLFSIRSVVELLGHDGVSAAMAVAFLQQLLVLMTFQTIEQAGIASLIGAGDTRTGFYVLGGVAILNVPMAYTLFRGIGDWPGMGLPGIALGTALAHTMGAIAILTILARGRAGLKLQLSLFRPSLDLVRRLLRISIPASVDTLSMGACQLWFLSLVIAMGSTQETAHGIAIRWESLGYLSGMAFATAASTLVGQNLGAKRFEDAKRLGWTCFAWGCGIMCLMGSIFFTLAPNMFRLIAPNENQTDVIEAGVPILRLVAFAMPALSCVIIFTGALRGAGDTRWPLLFTWIGFLVIRLPLAYFLTRDELNLGPLGSISGYNCGLFGAWIAMFIDLWLRGLFFLLRFAGGRWRFTRV
ncbi:MATE family efflux transporter [Tuwongella immobilis]|uniref:Multidrug-efflux transporter n=1 Tax=Tuwongella immobilis TaxID=692036 RepID=A0A6C2YWD8_9BACT|nr:MATE family efflux transporter [Tuwongella immobilis]VIP05175.1 mate efflux family protein : Putative efflux protein, MATE family OS=Singulisphaera acidiphila (strain ATCC BAA-1392 / DSM 18658 / VKM B-2454 / MOB10) GN=Sinac_3011 PE=4 SV=1: MatE: MatE [Tuwongella immobilis]VTS07706.1 mate efflux family protein : Putative efflux protein, MATE family OS=Singulisphaera acidiphila (strain ATCC BAA-1392 / DSM 18658 / VKM B-2454 / MOB10) GN=Sinac_3011 PE=4 SV=1: MatE: MatE [Tuwongella immobilis]